MSISKFAFGRFIGLTICLSLITTGCFFVGETGPQGEPGAQGEAGVAGEDGTSEQGAPGVPGEQGEQGESGLDGQSGVDGQNGLNGDDGLPGQDGDDGEDLTHPAGTPIVESLADVTGGLLVVGDLLDITGQDLATVDTVLCGDYSAPILEQTDETLRIQIPAQVPNGLNTLRLINLDADTGFVESVAAVKVHRLALFMGAMNDKIVIVDTTDHSILARVERTIAVMPNEGIEPPYQIAFANHGSLALIPTGDGEVSWIDLTSVGSDDSVVPINGVVPLYDENDVNDSTQMTTIGVTVSPDSTLAVVADEMREQLWALTIDEAFPPYAAPLSLATGTPLDMNIDTGPRYPTFVGENTLVVPCKISDELAIIRRDLDTLFTTDPPVAVGGRPMQAAFIPSRAALLTATRDIDPTTNKLSSFLVGGAAVSNPLNVELTIDNLYTFAISPDGGFAYIIVLNSDVIGSVLLTDTALVNIADSGDTLSSMQARSMAVDPVAGEFLYVGMNAGDFVDVFKIESGGTLLREPAPPLQGDTDLARCYGIGIQP